MAEKSLQWREVGERSPRGRSLAPPARGRASLRERRRRIRSRSRGPATPPPTGAALATQVPWNCLARSYWGFLARIFFGLIRVIHVSESPTIVMVSRHIPLLHFRAPEYETEESRGRTTWWIERGLLVAKRGRGRGFLRLSVEPLDRETSADTAAVLVRVEVRNFNPSFRGKGQFARFGGWLYSQTQLRIHILVCNAFLRSLTRAELLRPSLG
jgi:hypothetical protein